LVERRDDERVWLRRGEGGVVVDRMDIGFEDGKWMEMDQDQWRTYEFCSGGGGVQQIQLRTQGRESGVLGAVAP
jgi:hypothetical protein